MKKVIILYDSMFGNTKKVAMSLSRGLEEGGFYVDTRHIKDFKINQLENYDVIGIGGPTHFHGASKLMKGFLNKIKGLNIENKQGFAFETKADFRLAGSAAKRIMRYLKKMKLNIINPIITGIVVDKKGPLQESTLNTMEKLGLRLSDKINNSKEEEVIENNF
ncbi:MAG: flavodoxin domain-containing protein [Candidatus Thorarchaeota archaeon]